MLTHAPLPRWRDVIRALVGKPAVPTALAKPWHREGEVAGWLSRSAWSLSLIALWRQQAASHNKPVIYWFPDFFCNESLLLLRHNGVRLIFYPVTESLQPNFQACRELASEAPPDIFVLVHYFGTPNPPAPARDFCARHGAWLVEDAAHVLRPITGVGEYGDFVLYSPHKLLPLPDGAVLVARSGGPGKLGDDGLKKLGDADKWTDQLTPLVNDLGIVKARSGCAIWLVKRLLQTMGIGVRPKYLAFTESIAQEPQNIVSAKIIHPRMSKLALRLLTRTSAMLSDAARWRERHQLLWDQMLLMEQGGLCAASRPEKRTWTPYFAAFTGAANAVEQHYAMLQQRGLPVSTWPDLPPEVIAQRDKHAVAWACRHCYLFLPLHQSVRADDFTFRRKIPVATIDIQWDAFTREQWHGWMQAVGRSNLLQSWAYGEAKASTGGWQVRRGVFVRQGEPIAIVQMLEKRVGGLLKILRVNRGPLFICNRITEGDRHAVLLKLTELGSVLRGTLLSMAPELCLDGSALKLAAHYGIKIFRPRGWESIWLDLRLSPEILRKQLNGKWRNMLVIAEKHELTIEVGTTRELFDWILARHQEDRQEKNFQGIEISTLQTFWSEAGEDCPLIVMRTLHEGQSVAGICLACHGTAATYLLGWNGEEGRRLKANQWLLWNAALYLQQRGMQWFDLGGIDMDNCPGITEFKLGLRGEPYELVGEGWVC